MRFVMRVAAVLALAVAPAWAVVPAPGGNYGDALRWYGRAAEAGDVQAQYLLAVKYENGIGFDRDMAKAAVWYGKAAEQGHVEAQFKLATMLAQGADVPQDLGAALGWYRSAAEGGLAAAQYNLGVALLNGGGVERDLIEAFAWVSLAADQGLVVAGALKDRLLEALPAETLAEAEDRAETLGAKPSAN